jgi:hypothetical protein
MTTQFATKEQALHYGAACAGFKVPEERERVLAGAEISDEVLGFPHSIPATEDRPGVEKRIEVYTFENPDGVKVGVGVGEFRNGYDLWLIHIDSGTSRRV